MTKTGTILVTLALVLSTLGLAVAQTALTANAGTDRTVNVGQNLAFDGTASTGDIATYNWDFGDGSTGTGPTATKSYATAGSYTVTLVVVDASGNTATDTASVTVRTVDTTPPTITHTDVTSGTANNAIGISATVTDNVGVDSVTLYYKNATSADYVSTSMSASGSTYSAQIPASVTTSNVNYYIRAQDSKSPTPNAATYPAGAPSTNVTISLTDAAAPTITHTPASSVIAGTTLSVSATVTDNVGVTAVTLYYRFGSSGVYSSSTMTESAGAYSASISVPSSGVSTVQYYVQAADAASNEARAPTTAPGTPTSVTVTTANAPSITHTPPASATPGSSLTVTATISAASGLTISNTLVSYRAVGSTAWTNRTMSNGVATIPGDAINDGGVQYVLIATDSASTTSYHPAAGYSGPHTIRTPPATPTGLAVTRTTSGAELSWDALSSTTTSSVGSYKVYRSTSATSGFTTALATVTSAEFTDAAASSGVAYHYKVSAVDDHAAEGALSSGVASTRGVIPAAPTGVTATAGSPNALTVTWSAVTGAGWYLVQSSTDGATWTPGANVTTTNAAVTGLTAGQAYAVRVIPYNAFDEAGAASASASGTPLELPGAPSGLTASRDASGVNLAWTPVAGTAGAPVTGYAIERSTTGGAPWTTVDTVTVTAFADTNVTAGVAYSYRVAAVNDLGAGATSASVTTDRGARPIAPTLALSAGYGNVTVSWFSVTNAAYYLVQTSADNVSFTTTANVTGTMTTLTGLTNGNPVHVRVVPVNAWHEEGVTSVARSMTPIASTVDGGGTSTATLSITHPGAGGIVSGPVTITGTASESVQFVRVEIEGVTIGPANGTSAWSFAWDPSDVPDGSYLVRVIAVNGGVAHQEIVILVDRGVPSVEPVTPLGTVDAGRVPVTVHVTDASPVTLTLTLDGEPVPVTGASGAFTADGVLLGPGSHTFQATAKDAAGRVSVKSWTVTARATTTLPPLDVRVADAPAEGARVAGTQDVTFTVPTGLTADEYAVTVNGAPATATLTGATVRVTVHEDGPVTVALRVTTADGQDAHATRAFTIDNDGPVITLALPVDGIHAGAVVTATLADDAGVDAASVRVRVDGNDVTADARVTDGRVEVTVPADLADGEHALTIEARDALGNVREASGTFRVVAADAGSEDVAGEDGTASQGDEESRKTRLLPGFEAAFAAVGLLAVAYALRRRMA